jgi:Putative methyltransferase
MFYNRTQRTRSVPAALMRRGRILEVPLYYLLRSSDMAREGFEQGGSYRFADHIYCDQASGSGRFGRWLDRRILALPAVRSFRSRFLEARAALSQFLMERRNTSAVLDVLSVPSGIPRELIEAACCFQGRGGSLDHIMFHAVDLDPEVLNLAQGIAEAVGLRLSVHQGDALDPNAYPCQFDFITSTGLTEFLDDNQVAYFYKLLFGRLRPGGVLFTSAMRSRWISKYLLRLAELRVHYRDAEKLAELATRIPFSQIQLWRDELGIQSFLRAQK